MLSKINKTLLAATVITATVSLGAIEEAFKAGKDSQKAADLAETEKRLDDQIRQVSERLAALYTLRDIAPKVKLTPTQTIFATGKDEDGDYIELVAYTFNPQSYNYGKPVGTAAKTMRLYYNGKDLSRIKTIVDDQNFFEQYKYYTKASHPNPTKGNPNEMQLATSFNKPTELAEKNPDYKVKLGDVENDPTNPNRIKFKRDFYIEHLIYFEKLFRFTFEFQKRGASNGDVETINRMKNSLRY
ncbi:MAG: hypothetical protein J0L53_08180 [Spirochaetes bacterium]|nr:hypothetical protein [Spirochaetota bacterium]MBX3720516.1 hypothetical protein [Turneriella sp.]